MAKSVAWMFVSGALVATTACSVNTKPGEVDLKSKVRYEKDASVNDTTTFIGQTIEVDNDGVNPATNGGIKIIADASTTTVSAIAHVTAYADGDDEASADLSIADAIGTFTITGSADSIVVKCNHGNDHGSSSEAQAGCEYLEVHIPAGSATQPVALTAKSGNGGLVVTGPVYGSAPNITSGGTGDLDVSLTPAVGSVNVIAGGDAVTLRVPSDFSVDSLQIVSKADPAAIDTSDFPSLQNDTSYGTVGAGAASIQLGSQGTLSTDLVSLKSQ